MNNDLFATELPTFPGEDITANFFNRFHIMLDGSNARIALGYQYVPFKDVIYKEVVMMNLADFKEFLKIGSESVIQLEKQLSKINQ